MGGYGILLNYNFMMIQYGLPLMTLIASSVGNGFIYGFGSVDYTVKTSQIIVIVFLFAIGNYNLNKN
jgi:hypothetical protein